MTDVVDVAIHSSQFPEQVRRDLLHSLRSRRMAHKFHYDSIKQTQKWLALHRQFSPSRHDANCRAVYDRCFEAVANQVKSRKLHLLGLGCGGGQKDTRLITLLKRRNKEIFYTPSDVATAMVLAARRTALQALPEDRISPLVCDLATADNLPSLFNRPGPGSARRILTFFGMIPNFEPQEILPKLASIVRPGDYLLFSANLAPGDDYTAGMRLILPQYDNAPTREWLLASLTDLGVAARDGKLVLKIETTRSGLQRIVADFRFRRARKVMVDDETIGFKSGESIRLFFSYRYTPDRIRTLLSAHHLRIRNQWVTESREEGVFFCERG